MYQLWFDATAAANVRMLPKHSLPVTVTKLYHTNLRTKYKKNHNYVSIKVWATAAAYGLVWRTAAWLCPKRDPLAWFDLHWLIMAVWQLWAGHPAPPVTCELQPLHTIRTYVMVSVTWWCDVAMHHISRHGKCKMWQMVSRVAEWAARADSLSSCCCFPLFFLFLAHKECPCP